MQKRLKAGNKFQALTMLTVLLIVAKAIQAQVTTATSQSAIVSGLGSSAGIAVDPIGNVYAIDGVNGQLLNVPGGNGSATTLISSLASPGQVAVDVSRNLYIAAGTANQVTEYLYTNGALNFNAPVKIGTGLGQVSGVAVDLSGNVYIVDAGNKQVVEVAKSGAQTTLKTGLTAPKQIAVDRLGNVYVADSGANAVIMLPVGGGASTTLGTGLSAPQGVATDVQNNLYIADTGNGRILKLPYIAPAPSSQTVYVSGLTSPVSIALDTRSALYIAASGSLYRFSSGGIYTASTTPVGGGIYFGLLPVNTTSQVFPVTLTFAASVAPATIKVVTTGITGLDYQDAGGDTCVAGTTYAAGSSCTVNVTFKPLAVGPRYGAIVFYNSTNQIVSTTYLGGGGLGAVINVDPGLLSTLSPTAPPGTAGFSVDSARGVAIDAAGDIFLADTGQGRVVVLPPGSQVGGGTATTVIPTQKVASTATYGINDLVIDGAGNFINADGSSSVYLIPNENGTWNPNDTYLLDGGYAGHVRILSVDVAGNVFVGDNTGAFVYEIPQGLTGSKGISVPYGPTGAGCLGVAVDLFGNLAVSDNANSKAYYVPATGVAPYTIGAGLNGPWGIAMDASGSVYVADYSAAITVRIPNEYGTVNTGDQYTFTAGNVKSFGIAVDPTGNLYETANANNYKSYLFYNRNTDKLALATTAVGSTSTLTQQAQLSNSGTSPTSAISALSYLYDPFDFTVNTTIGNSCSFSLGLQTGFTCIAAWNFTPQVTGARTASVTVSNVVSSAVITLTGTASGSAPAGTVAIVLSLTSPTTTPAPGEALVISAAVTGSTAGSAPTGAVTFLVDGVATASGAVTAGTAILSLPAGLALGSHTITATYSGDTNYAALTTPATLTFSVALGASTVSVFSYGANANVGQAVTLTGTVTQDSGLPVPTGTLTFLDGTTQIGSAKLPTGQNSVSIAVSTLSAGAHTITVSYTGDGDYNPGTSTSIAVTIGSYVSTSTSLSVLPTQPVGGYTYGTALNASSTVTFTGSTKTPSGSVNFILDSQSSPVTLSASTASETLTPGAGSHTLVASYSGDANFATSTSSLISFTVLRAPTSLALTASSNAINAGTPITLTATATAKTTPVGSVTFYNGANALGTVSLVNGVATLITSALPSGSIGISASFIANDNFAASTSPTVTVVVTKQNAAITISSTSQVILQTDQPPTFTATVSSGGTPTPTGTVTFTITGPTTGTLVAAISVSSGNAIWQAPQPPAPSGFPFGSMGSYTSGLYTITASYSGDTNFFPSTQSVALPFYVAPTTGYAGDFSGVITPSPLTIPIGTTGVATLTLTPINNYFGNITITCPNLPLYTTCNVSPNTVQLNGSGTSVVSQINIVTQQYQVKLWQPGRTPADMHSAVTQVCSLLGGGVLLSLVLGSFRRGRRLLRSAGVWGALSMLLLLAGMGSLTACGSHAPIATPKETTTVNITATGSGGIVHLIPVQVTFQ